MTPRILIAGRDEQQRQWLRHHLQTLWPDVEPPSLDLEQFERHLDSITRRNYDVVLLCARRRLACNTLRSVRSSSWASSRSRGR